MVPIHSAMAQRGTGSSPSAPTGGTRPNSSIYFGKGPNSNVQAPMKLQISTPKKTLALTRPWCVAILWSLVVGTGSFRAFSAEPIPVVSAWLNAQANIHTWSADFTQTKFLKSLSQPLKATGHLWFAEPNRIRWELRRPQQTTAIIGP